MDAGKIPSVASQRHSPSITTVLASAVLEWLLMFMLFIGACFSYLVTKFAHSCKLQVPCLLCSRLDNVLGNQRTGFYWDLICCNHKTEISSLVLCHAHSKLVDVHRICESCLFSFVTINKSNAEKYRLLVGKLGAESYPELDQRPLLGDHNKPLLGTRNCSSCYRQWIPRGYAQKLLQTPSIDFNGIDVDASIALPDIPVGSSHIMKKIHDESSVSVRDLHMDNTAFDPSTHVKFKMIKISSDTESEVPFSYDDSASSLIRKIGEPEENPSVQNEYPQHHIIAPKDNLTSDQLIDVESVTKSPLLDSEVQLEVNDNDCHDSTATSTVTGDGLDKQSWPQAQASISRSSEPKSFVEVPTSPRINETPIVTAKKNCIQRTSEGPEKGVREAGEISKVCHDSNSASDACAELNAFTSDNGLQLPNSLNLLDAYKLAVGKRERQSSGKLSEQSSFKASSRVSEDLKFLLSQISFARGIDLSSNDMSPKVSKSIDDQKTSDASCSIGVHSLQKRISLERNESGFSLDGSTVSEIDGESVVDRLKRQVEHDKKLMGALYKELEEERNASSIAVNQALALITKLQEEKATLHMEALQCIRMMEEQAEYDGEALQKANTLVAEKEKEIQELEAVVEFYKNKFGDVLTIESTREPIYD